MSSNAPHTWSWRRFYLFTLALGLIFLAHDVWYVIAADSSGWVPFLYPALFIGGGFFFRHRSRTEEAEALESDLFSMPAARTSLWRTRVEQAKADGNYPHTLIG